MLDAVARSAENWLEAHRVTTALAPATGVYSVSTADSISADPGLDLRAENIGPWANTAEVVFSERTSDVSFFYGRVSFAFSWPNPTGQDVLCTVTGLFGVAATAVVTADSYWWPLAPTPPASKIDVIAEHIFLGYVLQYENLFLPATGKLEADLSCEIAWLANDGGGYFDAAVNGRKLSGFGVLIDTQPREVFAASPPAHA
jgi:hypothetical protein